MNVTRLRDLGGIAPAAAGLGVTRCAYCAEDCTPAVAEESRPATLMARYWAEPAVRAHLFSDATEQRQREIAVHEGGHSVGWLAGGGERGCTGSTCAAITAPPSA